MAYSVAFTGRARKDLAALPDRIRRQLIARIAKLADDPRPNGSKKLEGSSGEYRIRSGDYRVLYQVHDREILVLIVRVADPKDAYWDR